MAMFSRSSTAYKNDGSVVNAGVPRFERIGKNLFDKSKAIYGYRVGTPGTLEPHSDYVTSDYIRVYKDNVMINSNCGTNYRRFFYDINKNPIAGSFTQSASAFTIAQDGYMRFTMYKNNVDVAQLELGSTATAYEPYQEGVLVEEGTVNILSAANSQSISAAVNVTVVSGTKYTASCKTGSLVLSGAGTGTVTPSTPITITASGTTLTLTGTATYNQVEAKNYATNWQIGGTGRTPESLTIPASALNASEGTIEFDCLYPAILPQLSFLFDMRGVYDYNPTMTVGANSNLVTITAKLNNTYGRSSFPIAVGVKKRLGLRYKKDYTLDVYYDGILKASLSIFNGLDSNALSLGQRLKGGGNHANAYFSNLRISNKARTDAELANTGALTVDEWTTYFCSFNGNLGAQTAPRTIAASGEGATKQSRTGAGYRSMNAKAAVKSYILRTAKFYPTITTSAAGTVNLARTGSGYRTAAIQSAADVKLIEPSIEISTAVIERKGITTVIERQSTTEVIGLPYVGDTVTLKAEFYTKGGLLADPVNISLKFFDSLKNQIGTTITIGSQHRISAGVYEYDYTVPSGYSNIFYEFAATQESTPQLIPGRISCKQRVDA